MVSIDEAIAVFIDDRRNSASCDCELCAAHRRILAISVRGDVSEMRALIEELSEANCNIGEELEMANAEIERLKGK